MIPPAQRPFEEEVIDRLARIETTLESAAGSRQDHETRLRKVEKSQWLLFGGAACIAPLLQHIGGFIWK
jgi:hypothetical protein